MTTSSFKTGYDGVSFLAGNAAYDPPATGLFAGGWIGSALNTIDYITISSTGNAIDFGDLTEAREGAGAGASSTRAVFGGGWTGSSNSNVIDYITIASTGNATDFGDLTLARYDVAGCSNSTRAIFAGGGT